MENTKNNGFIFYVPNEKIKNEILKQVSEFSAIFLKNDIIVNPYIKDNNILIIPKSETTGIPIKLI